MAKIELIKKARELDEEMREKIEGEEKNKTLLEKIEELRAKEKPRIYSLRREFNEQDFEIVEGWLKGEITGKEIMRVVYPGGEPGSHYFSYIGQVLKKFYSEGKVKIIK